MNSTLGSVVPLAMFLMISLSRAVPDSKAFHRFQQSTCSLISDDSHSLRPAGTMYIYVMHFYVLGYRELKNPLYVDVPSPFAPVPSL